MRHAVLARCQHGLARSAAARTVAIEDSTNGLTSALAAGMKVVAVPPLFHPPAADLLDDVDAVIPTLDDLTVDHVRGLFS